MNTVQLVRQALVTQLIIIVNVLFVQAEPEGVIDSNRRGRNDNDDDSAVAAGLRTAKPNRHGCNTRRTVQQTT